MVLDDALESAKEVPRPVNTPGLRGGEGTVWTWCAVQFRGPYWGKRFSPTVVQRRLDLVPTFKINSVGLSEDENFAHVATLGAIEIKPRGITTLVAIKFRS
jgi:hypothetical protein